MQVYDVYSDTLTQNLSALSISRGHISQRITSQSLARPHGRGMDLPCGFKFCLAVVLCSISCYIPLPYIESSVVRSQRYSQVEIWTQCWFLPGNKNFFLLYRVHYKSNMAYIQHISPITKMVVPPQTIKFKSIVNHARISNILCSVVGMCKRQHLCMTTAKTLLGGY